MKKTKIYIVEDNAHIIEDIKFLLNHECAEISEVINAFQHPDKMYDFLIRAEKESLPDLIISDVDFSKAKLEVQHEHCLKMVQKIKSDNQLKYIPILIITRHSAIEHIFLELYPFINGFIDKDEMRSELPRSINVFHYGDENAAYFGKYTAWVEKAQTYATKPWESLTERQQAILTSILKGVPRKRWDIYADAPTLTREVDRIFLHLASASHNHTDLMREYKRQHLDTTVAIIKMCKAFNHPLAI